jgi:voltage-gated potassium channel Kch
MVAIYAAGAALRGTGGIYSGVRVYWFRVGSGPDTGRSSGGLLILRHAGGNHIERVRVALGHGDFTALQVDSSAGLVLLAGILLLIPGFITDFLAVLLLVPPLRRVAAKAFEARATRHDRDAVIDLAPEQWHKVPDPSLPKRRREKDPC